MKYENAQNLLPENVINLIQEHIEGRYCEYIPKYKAPFIYSVYNGTKSIEEWILGVEGKWVD
ncbi:hypothetical protein [Dethiothermospora halolimnae]|uniref:hypothetical protein n=1 Tax=Dethiothermospora halolimnae TaxID=3114390 RepID=UPI003CCBE1F6